MAEMELNKGHKRDGVQNKEENLVMPIRTDENALSALKPPAPDPSPEERIVPEGLITTENIAAFSLVTDLLTSHPSLCRDPETNRYYVSGRHNADSVLQNLVPRIKNLPNHQTLRVEMGNVCATNDFVEAILSSLFFKSSKERATTGKQVVFFDPDEATRLAIRHTIRSIGGRYTNCMIARTDTTPWTLIVVGRMEPHLEKVLSHVRLQSVVTVPELVAAKISTSEGNASGTLSVLWDMGLIRKLKTENNSKKTGRPASRFFAYHPFLDYYPNFPTKLPLLKYEADMP